MTGNKKLMIALFSICLVVIAGLLTTVIVLATQSGKITSSINISYTAVDIQGSVSATYTVENGSPVALVNGEGETEIVFDATDASLTGSLGVQDSNPINTLTSTNDSVTFEYTFKNTGSVAYTAVLNYTAASADNIIIEWYNESASGGAAWETLAQSGNQTITVAGAANAEAPVTETFQIRITIDDVAQNVNFSPSFAWTLAAVGD